MAQDAADRVHAAFLDRLARGDFPPGETARRPAGLAPETAVAIFRAQCVSRHMDRMARRMQKAGQGFYTIGSSGHEGMAAVAAALRPDDMAFLHYRDAAFQIARAMQVPGQTPTWDLALSFASSAEDPISGGRHKVLGSHALSIPPQTSTIASHLPKAVGTAYSIGLARRCGVQGRLPADGLVVASFGDASANHSTAQGAFNAAGWAAYQSVPMPILFVCEDNGIGISVRTPSGWIAESFRARPGLDYMATDGRNLFDAWEVTRRAAAQIRRTRRPVFLHLPTVRLLGHAGSDVEAGYRRPEEIAQAEADDPLLHSARLLIEAGILTAERVRRHYDEVGATCARVSDAAVTRPRLSDAEGVMASLVPPRREPRPTNGPDPQARARVFGGDARALDQPQPMAKLINWALTDLMLEHPGIVLMGEDVGAKGGVYGVTQKLRDRFGRDRVIDTLLDEQSILGLGLGLAHNGLLPIPEIQFLAYLHNAEDQLRGEAATLPFFSNGQYTNPMVVRIAGLGYQRGFGGHFHNDNAIAVLRDIPGMIVACPSTGASAVRLLREAVRLAEEEQRVVVFLEPIALYQARDVEAGDGAWMTAYPPAGASIGAGEVGVHGDGTDLAIVSYANGCHLAHQALPRLREAGLSVRVVDLNWLVPLPEASLLAALDGVRDVLIVDECRRSAGPSEGLMTLLSEAGRTGHARLTAEDSFIATGPAYAATLPSVHGIVAAALALTGRDR